MTTKQNEIAIITVFAILIAGLFGVVFSAMNVASAEQQEHQAAIINCNKLPTVEAKLSNGRLLTLCLNTTTGDITTPVATNGKIQG